MKRAAFQLLGAIVAWSTLAVAFAVGRFLGAQLTGPGASFSHLLWDSLPSYWLWAAVTPLILWIARRVPFSRGRISTAALKHLCAYFAVALCHTAAGVLLHLPGTAENSGFTTAFATQFGHECDWDFWIYGVLVGLSHLLRYQQRLAEGEVRAARLANQLAGVQLKTLRSKLRPDFLFDTLDLISSLMDDDIEGAENMMADLGLILRTSFAEAQFVSIANEVELLEAYLRIQQRRLPIPLRFSFDIAAPALPILVPSQLLHFRAEHAIQHGSDRRLRSLILTVKASIINGELELAMTDNAVTDDLRLDDGAELAAIRNRLKHLYGMDIAVHSQALPAMRYRITVRLPLHKQTTEDTRNHAQYPHRDSGRRRVGAPAGPFALGNGSSD